ncbi:MAG: AMP-binding protein [Jatrophihabitans sp.]|uniref:AMP-binding protein n=1 Tax=Jatrophihabitans sp. TaxID=1932789 RepID=UPI003F7E029A
MNQPETSIPDRPSSRSGLPAVPADPARLLRRVVRTAQNVAEVVRFGGLETEDESSPYTVEAEQLNYRLRHYFADDVPAGAPPIILVPPLMVTTEVWDVSQDTSAVAALHRVGADPWVVDFGRPDHEPGGLKRTLTDHVLAVSDAIERVTKATGQKVILAGYSQGGMFAYQTAAFRRGDDIDSLITFGSPVDTRAPLPVPIAPEKVARLANEVVESGLLAHVSMPGWVARTGFKMLTPAKSLQARVKFLLALHDRDALLPRERQRRFLDNEGWTAYSGPAIAELLEQFVTHNRMLVGGFVIDDRLVTLADIDLPILTFVGIKDTIGHPDAVRAIRQAAPRAQVYEVTLNAGHFGLVVGSAATNFSWPAVADWVQWRRDGGELPASIRPAETVDEQAPPLSAGAVMAAQVAEVGLGAGRFALDSTRRVVRLARSIATEAPVQLPRLTRIEQLDPRTRISLGQLLDEQARRSAEDICFLFADRAYRQGEVKHRVDSVVRGLISVGVRQGDRVGVLMETRPSAVAVLAALSRLGATAVLLRPDGDPAREAELGGITWVVSDPEHVGLADTITGVRWAVLGGGAPAADAADARELHPDVIDMERIDPATVTLPAWYTPNPHRAGDVAFVLFTGEGAGTKALPITNRRWALSALGTASAAALKPGHTVYCTTPIYHSSCLLMSIGGAVASGARFALGHDGDPATFWDEVRRYGATHVSYTWTSLRRVVDAPPNPAERSHPIQMFLGSGMPRNLWRRTAARFPDAKVLEFYASAEGETILVNLTGRTPGSMGRPLPGTAEVRVARYDLRKRQLKLGADGLARECATDEVGLLLARVDPNDAGAGTALRSVFEAGDAWQSTDDLFLRDDHDDLWLAGSVPEVLLTSDGAVLPAGARFALGSIPGVDLVVAYGVDDPERGEPVLVGAATLRPGASLDTAALEAAVDKLPVSQRPHYVQIVDEIPVTTWSRPMWRPLQQQGVPSPEHAVAVWRLRDDRAHYEQLVAAPAEG